MAHLHLKEAKDSQRSKVHDIVGHADAQRWIHPVDKAQNLAYTANKHLDPLPLPTKESAGP